MQQQAIKDTAKNTGLLTTENRARAKCGGEKNKKRNATQTHTDVRMCFLHGPLLYVNLLYVSNLPPIYTDVQNIKCLRKNRRTKKHARTHIHTQKDVMDLAHRNQTQSSLAFGQIQFRLFAFMMAGFLLTYVAQ